MALFGNIPSRWDVESPVFGDSVDARIPSKHLVLGGEPAGILGMLLNCQSEGDVHFTTNTDLPITQDAGPLLKRYRNVWVASGATVTAANRCRGMAWLVEGDLIVDGTITMTARGASAASAEVRIGDGAKAGNAWVLTRADMQRLLHYLRSGAAPDARARLGVRAVEDYSVSDLVLASATGASGGGGQTKSNSYAAGIAGSAGTVNRTGGGGSGGLWGYAAPGVAVTKPGAPGTSFSGGPGSGGTTGVNVTASNTSVPSATGGPGGNAMAINTTTAWASGGAGNPGGLGQNNGAHAPAGDGEDGTGGLLMLIVLGRVVVSASGVISANGAAGGSVNPSYISGGGGGSGGGNVQIVYGESYANNGSIEANGGPGGPGYSTTLTAGGAGGAGSVRVTPLSGLLS